MFELKKEGPPDQKKPIFANEPTPTRRLAEGVMLVAAAVVFGLSANYLPFVWLIAAFLWPVPLALLVRRFGPGFGLGGILLTTVILAIFTGPISALLNLLNMGGVAFWYGWAARQEIKPWTTVIIGVFISAISMVLLLLGSTWLTGLHVNDLMKQIEDFVDFYINTMQQNPQMRQQLQQLQGSMTTAEFSEYLKNYLTSMLPASLIVISMIETSVCYAVIKYVFRRLGYPMAKLSPFKDWRLPWYTLWGLIIALLAFVAFHQMELEWCRALFNNIMYIYQPLLMLAGLALYYWLAEFWKKPWLIWTMVFMAIGFFNVVGPMLMLMGMADSVWDVRQMLINKKQRQG